MKRLSRRALLRGAGGIALGLPFLEAMGAGTRLSRLSRSTAATGTSPKRFILFFTPDGIRPADWWPAGLGYNGSTYTWPVGVWNAGQWQINPTLVTQPPGYGYNGSLTGGLPSPGTYPWVSLSPYQGNLLWTRGVRLRSADVDNNSMDGGHEKPMGHITTGTTTVMDAGGNWMGGGISIDQAVSQAISDPSQPSLHYAIDWTPGNGPIFTYLSYTGPAATVDPETDPMSAATTLFGNYNFPTSQLTQLYAQRRSVLDYVQGDLSSLIGRLGGDDQRRLELHLDSIRATESLLAPSVIPAACAPYSATYPDKPTTGRAFMELMLTAFACDRARVAVMQWGRSTTDVTWPWVDTAEDIHPLSHDGTPPYGQMNAFFAGELAYLLARLQATPDGAGTMLDNTVILWLSNHGEPHDWMLPFVVASGSNIPLAKNRFFSSFSQDYDQFTPSTYSSCAPHNNLYVSILQALGSTATTFGNPAVCTGPLAQAAP